MKPTVEELLLTIVGTIMFGAFFVFVLGLEPM